MNYTERIANGKKHSTPVSTSAHETGNELPPAMVEYYLNAYYPKRARRPKIQISDVINYIAYVDMQEIQIINSALIRRAKS
jgi:hypothetical protein